MASKFTPEMRGALIERFAVGCTVADAASAVGVSEMTVKRWLARGRREKGTEYSQFTDAVDRAREEVKNRPEPMDAEELARVVSTAARKGNTQAMKLRWEMIRADRDEDQDQEPADPIDELDELAARREQRAV
jgi:transposase